MVEATLQRRIRLAVEFILLYVGIPMLFIQRILPPKPIPFLIAISLVTAVLLVRDAAFEHRYTFVFTAPRDLLILMAKRLLFCAALMVLGTYLIYPELLFAMLRTRPGIWLAVIVFYPILSVLPQELVYRTFIFHRYRKLFPSDRLRIVASGLAFGFVHLLYGNWVAVVLSTIGGFIFAYTYASYRSLFLVSLEHALYGQLVFTVGLGQFFYSGVLR
ncbi:MAG: CPBP family intramembrane metalloprotease [Bdellovibrionales bacterium]|nr:CPBP family intramembrane metalloprotease [Bdellovibrionales bacterium]